MDERPIVFSGMQPDGDLHLGNLLGALRPWVMEQGEVRGFFCVVDLHALTVVRDPQELRSKSRQVAALYLAAGIDPEVSTLLLQSQVPQHTELAWILACLTPVGWLQRMTQFKDRSRRHGAEAIGSGVFIYPVLMAADILLYKARYVPVGEDQRQHMELTRDLAARFNHLYGETFPVPEARIGHRGAGSRVMALDDPEAKMSKSVGGEAGRIGLLDPPDLIRSKLMRAKTDSASALDPQSISAGVANLLEIHSALSGASARQTLGDFQGRGYGELKRAVAEQAVQALAPIQARYGQLMSDPTELDSILERGAERAAAVAEATMAEVRARVGLPSRAISRQLPGQALPVAG